MNSTLTPTAQSLTPAMAIELALDGPSDEIHADLLDQEAAAREELTRCVHAHNNALSAAQDGLDSSEYRDLEDARSNYNDAVAALRDSRL